jgi:phenylalanyl-tRNA synthetase alpha subunit
MGIPNSLLKSADEIAHEFQKVEIEAANQHTAVREASEQRDSLGADKVFVPSTHPARERSERPDSESLMN